MVVKSIHFATAICLEGQLDGADQDVYYVVSFLRLSPDVVSVINTPEKTLSQMELVIAM